MAKILAEGRDLSKTFPARGQGKGAVLHGVSQVDLVVYEGETLALVGESGCGKSTLGRLLLGLLPPTQGQVFFDGRDLAACSPRDLRALRRQMQMVFQDTAASLNPRLTVEGILAEPLRVHRLCPRREIPARAAVLLDQVGLPRDLLGRYPHALSGGQRQRVGIARALALSPRLVVCDEPVSALDVSIQAQILKLMNDLKEKTGTSIMLITHDLGVVAQMADHVNVMYAGKVVESAPVFEIFKNPKHPYTVGLMSSMPSLNSGSKRLSTIEGNVPNPINLPKGCYFADRCPKAMPKCRESQPHDVKVGSRHHVSCFLFDDAKGEE